MTALAKIYEKPLSSNKLFLIKHLFNINMSKGGSVVDYLYEFNMVINRLSYVGVNFDDEFRALLYLSSLLECWNDLVMTITNYVSRSSALMFNDVVGAIFNEEMRGNVCGETSGNTLSKKKRGRKMERGRNSRNRSKSRKHRYKSKSRIVRWKCGKKGH